MFRPLCMRTDKTGRLSSSSLLPILAAAVPDTTTARRQAAQFRISYRKTKRAVEYAAPVSARSRVLRAGRVRLAVARAAPVWTPRRPHAVSPRSLARLRLRALLDLFPHRRVAVDVRRLPHHAALSAWVPRDVPLAVDSTLDRRVVLLDEN